MNGLRKFFWARNDTNDSAFQGVFWRGNVRYYRHNMLQFRLYPRTNKAIATQNTIEISKIQQKLRVLDSNRIALIGYNSHLLSNFIRQTFQPHRDTVFRKKMRHLNASLPVAKSRWKTALSRLPSRKPRRVALQIIYT